MVAFALVRNENLGVVIVLSIRILIEQRLSSKTELITVVMKRIGNRAFFHNASQAEPERYTKSDEIAVGLIK